MTPRNELSPLEARLAGWLACPEREDRWLSEETAAALEAAAPPVPLGETLEARLEALGERALRDLGFEAETPPETRTFGAYLAYLRREAGTSTVMLARGLGLDAALLGGLERGAVSLREVPARALAQLLRRLDGSLEMTERLLLAGTRPTAGARLYRRDPGSASPLARDEALGLLEALREEMKS